MEIANPAHPSIGRPLRWVIAGVHGTGSGFVGPEVHLASSVQEAGGDAIVLDWMAASYLAPGIKPRPHAVVVRAREQRLPGFPALFVVTASYPSEPAKRPAGVEMVRREGQLVGDAIVAARSLGLVLDNVLVEYAMFERMAHNEQIEVGLAAREFLAAAAAAVKPTTAK